MEGPVRPPSYFKDLYERCVAPVREQAVEEVVQQSLVQFEQAMRAGEHECLVIPAKPVDTGILHQVATRLEEWQGLRVYIAYASDGQSLSIKYVGTKQ